MDTRENYTSPDGFLRLLVIRKDGDITLGFDGYQWHTHGDVLVGEFQLRGVEGLSPEAATSRFVADVLEGRAILALSRIGGQLQDVWVTYSPEEYLERKLPEEVIEFRYWNGGYWQSG